jgi:hypothetical protein
MGDDGDGTLAAEGKDTLERDTAVSALEKKGVNAGSVSRRRFARL